MAIHLEELQALDLWRRATLDSVRRDAPDLSARQMALLLTVYLTPPPHTVRGLAETLKVSKPAITRGTTLAVVAISALRGRRSFRLFVASAVRDTGYSACDRNSTCLVRGGERGRFAS